MRCFFELIGVTLCCNSRANFPSTRLALHHMLISSSIPPSLANILPRYLKSDSYFILVSSIAIFRVWFSLLISITLDPWDKGTFVFLPQCNPCWHWSPQLKICDDQWRLIMLGKGVKITTNFSRFSWTSTISSQALLSRIPICPFQECAYYICWLSTRTAWLLWKIKQTCFPNISKWKAASMSLLSLNRAHLPTFKCTTELPDENER